MSTYSQDGRPLRLSTPLGPDALLLLSLDGHEAVSELFHFEVEAVAVRSQRVPVDRLLGQPVLVEHRVVEDEGRSSRYFHGIVSRIGEVGIDDHFIGYRLEVVPALWLLTLNVQSRIFQQQATPEILREVFRGLDVSFQLQGQYLSHNYCVQYQESDFHFASRMMEEEGIYYYFEHTQAGHRLVLGDRSADNPELAHESRVRFSLAPGGPLTAVRIERWQKFQEIRPGRYTLWDHSFELPGSHLDASAETAGLPPAGEAPSRQPEVFEYPGDYAHRFDSIGPEGEKKEPALEAVFDLNRQTAQLRLQEQQAQTLRIEGAGNCFHFTPGYRFHLEQHPYADGDYLLSRVEHSVSLPDFRTEPGGPVKPYGNRFLCLPRELAYRPPRRTPRSRVPGSQTATVVGPKDEELWTDQFGRIKVHFHWDRHGQSDGRDSCWVRVASSWAGKGYGMFTLPRVGQEVVVDFLEGDPDQPLVTGSVYNAAQMAPFSLPGNSTVSVLKTQTVQGDPSAFHGLAFDDEKDQELIYLRSQRDIIVSSIRNHTTYVPSNQFLQVGGGQMTVVGGLPLPFTAGNSRSETAESAEGEVGGKSGTGSQEDEPESENSHWLEQMGVPMLPIPLAFCMEGKYGIELDLVAGMKSYFDFPAVTEVVVDPFGLIGGLATQALGRFGSIVGPPGLTGETDIVYGNKTELHYGPLTEVHHGPTFRCHEKTKVPATLAAAFHAASVMLTIAMPAVLAPVTTGLWVQNATAIAFGVATALQFLVTQLEIKYSKAVAALDTAEEALKKAKEALKQLNPSTDGAFADQVQQLANDVTNLTADLEATFVGNSVSGPYSLFAGDFLASAMCRKDGTGKLALIAEVDLNLTAGGNLTAQSIDGDLTLRGQNLDFNSAANGRIQIRNSDQPLTSTTIVHLDPVQMRLLFGPSVNPTAEIVLDAQGITLTCGPSSIEITPQGIKLVGLVLDEKAIQRVSEAVLEQMKS